MTKPIRLGVNIDHIATIRNARGGIHPDPVQGALIAQKSKADGITLHLREDRRHIRDEDLIRIKKIIKLPINLEMAPTQEMLKIAIKTKPHAVCIVPEKRQEITTEGGLDIIKYQTLLASMIKQLHENKIKVSLFIDPDLNQINIAKKINANIIEIHTGEYCKAKGKKQIEQFNLIKQMAIHANKIGLECHAGHGLDYKTAKKIASINQIVELNIGHFLIGEAIFIGLENAIKKMRKTIAR
jgi:pyridoxine 5-phosphate synthase